MYAFWDFRKAVIAFVKWSVDTVLQESLHRKQLRLAVGEVCLAFIAHLVNCFLHHFQPLLQ